jgi:hypothetical protein
MSSGFPEKNILSHARVLRENGLVLALIMKMMFIYLENPPSSFNKEE